MATSPPILHLAHVHLSFGGTPLLQDASLSLGRDDRLSLVGRNGSGKSTLLKMAAGLIEPDAGEVFVQPGCVVRYLAQNPQFDSARNIADIVLADIFDNEDRQKAHQLMADLNLAGVRRIGELSGGEMRRVALAQAMACQPDILLLDEPTNHLDLPSIEWLEQALRTMPAAMVLVSHDRRFLSNMSRQTIWLDRGQTYDTGRPFAEFENWRDKFLEEEEQAQARLSQKIAREEDWMRYGVTARRKRNVRRVKELVSLRQKKTDQAVNMALTGLAVREAEASGKLVVKFDQVSFAYDDQPIVDNLSFTFNRGDRIGIIGPNGSGKTTLLKLILGDLAPSQGRIRTGKRLEKLVLDQSRSGIKKDWTIKDALTDGSGDLVHIGEETVHVIGYMKAFLFHPIQMRTPAHILSGGELARLLLARGLRHPSNFLVMDEPTNDLDLETLDLMQEMLAEYQGTIILVSHDRDFLDRSVTHLLVSEGEGQWVAHAGGYSQLAQKWALDKKAKTAKDKTGSGPSAKGPSSKTKPTPGKQTLSKETSHTATGGTTGNEASEEGRAWQDKPGLRGGRLSYMQSYKLERLPADIERLAAEIVAIEQQLADGKFFERDPQGFTAQANQLATLKEERQRCEDEWIELEILRESLAG